MQSSDSIGFHDPKHSMFAAGLANFLQVEQNSTIVVYPAACGMGSSDQTEQASVFDRAVRQRSGQPIVEAAAGYLQHPT
jgi:hypothetical protein